MSRQHTLANAGAAGRRLSTVLMLLGLVVLPACTVTPLYSTASNGNSVQAELAAISILPATDRLTQITRNELVFAFGAAQRVTTRYELSLRATSASVPDVTGVNIPLTRLTVTIRYSLVELESGEVIVSGSASADTSYQQSNQGFATERAREDAEARAARAAAESVRLEIAAALAADVSN